jgi:hypothetical protein
MSDTHISVDDVGIHLRVNVYYPLHDASCAKLIMKRVRPKQQKTVAADIIDVNEGVLQYTTAAGDFSEPGEYVIQSQVIFNDGAQLTGATHKLKVHDFFD